MKQIVTVYMCVRVCVCTMCVVMQYTIITGICNCVCFFYPDLSHFILPLLYNHIYIIFMLIMCVVDDVYSFFDFFLPSPQIPASTA